MEMPKFSEILRKLSFIKSYSSLLLPAAILVAGLAVFAVTVALGRSFTQKAQKESISIGNQVRSLADSTPAFGQVEVEKKYEQEYEKDVNQISLLATQTTQRSLLSYKIFPQPKDTSMLIFSEFDKSLQGTIENLIADVNGRDCPSQAELDEALKKSATVRPGARMRTSLSSVTGSEAKIIDGLCLEKAKSASVYVNPSDVAGYDFWKAYKASTMEAGIKDCWYWQVGYWITEDIFSTIKAMNTGSRNVYSSPVKRLVTLSFVAPNKRTTMRGTTMGASTASTDRPIYIMAAKDQLTESLTARLSNAEVDVVHFNLVVLVSEEDVLPFMRELCSSKEHKFTGYTNEQEPRTFKHNQITILESKVRSVDYDDTAHSLFRYGDDAVVELDLICEYIFYKNGYEEVKPESVKKDLQTAPKTP
jgi:hypothetical protein